MVMCDCTNCGGKDEFAMCENGLLRAQGMVYSSQRTSRRLNILLFALVVVLLATLALPQDHDEKVIPKAQSETSTQTAEQKKAG